MNKKLIRNSTLVLVIYFLVFGLLGDYLFYTLLQQYYFKTYIILPTLLAVTGLCQLYLFAKKEDKGQSGIITLLFSIGARFVLVLVLICVSLLVWKVSKIPYVISFASDYIPFMAFELLFYYRLKHHLTAQNK